MSSINEQLKNITLKELCIVIIFVYLFYYIVNNFTGFQFSSSVIYIFIIAYFLFRLRNSFHDFRRDLLNVFSKDILKYSLIVVLLNIFFSYGMLYLSDFILYVFPSLNFLLEFHLSSLHLSNSLVLTGGLLASILISPISEELIFRGVILNRLKIFLPATFAILVSSLLFAALHTYGAIISAFVFAMCMAILYIKTDNIFVPIFAHFLNNLLAEGIFIVDSQNLLFTNDLIMISVSILAVVSAVLIITSLILELNKVK